MSAKICSLKNALAHYSYLSKSTYVEVNEKAMVTFAYIH